ELTLLNGNAGLVLDNTVLAPPDALTVTDFSTLSPQDIDDACPYTTWTKDRVIYTLPKFMVFMDLFEKVVYPKGDPMEGQDLRSELTLLNGNAGLVLDNTVLAPPDALTVTDFSTLSPQDIDDACPYTTWTKDRVIYTLPKFMVFMDLFEKVVYPKGDPMEGQDL